MKTWLSIIVPSFNQAKYLRKTLESIVDQKTDEVELIVIDGGSTDGSVEILEEFNNDITYWQSARDEGQAHALEIGLSKATGLFVGWQNSDDLYTKGAFERFKAISESLEEGRERPDVYFSNVDLIDGSDNKLFRKYYTRFDSNIFKYVGWNITNQSAFYRRTAIIACGGFDKRFQYAMDGDLTYKLIRNRAKFRYVRDTWGAFRQHTESKGSNLQAVANEEWIILHSRENPSYDFRKPWRKQHRIKRCIFMCKRHWDLLRQGDWFAAAWGRIISSINK